MDKLQRFLSALGLAQKAGKLASGDTAVQFAIKTGKAFLILLASDMSENSKKEMNNIANRFNVPLEICLTKEQMGDAIGKGERACIAIIDKNFAAMIKKQLDIIER